MNRLCKSFLSRNQRSNTHQNPSWEKMSVGYNSMNSSWIPFILVSNWPQQFWYSNVSKGKTTRYLDIIVFIPSMVTKGSSVIALFNRIYRVNWVRILALSSAYCNWTKLFPVVIFFSSSKAGCMIFSASAINFSMTEFQNALYSHSMALHR